VATRSVCAISVTTDELACNSRHDRVTRQQPAVFAQLLCDFGVALQRAAWRLNGFDRTSRDVPMRHDGDVVRPLGAGIDLTGQRAAAPVKNPANEAHCFGGGVVNRGVRRHGLWLRNSNARPGTPEKRAGSR